MKLAGVILGGGEGRRMGGIDKPLLRLDGVTLLERIAARLRPQTDCIALSANGDPARFAGSGLPAIADEQQGLGPLAGILSGLVWARTQGCEALLTVPGDTPFIPLDLADALRPMPAVAVSMRIHHTVALWPTDCADPLRAHLQAGGSRSVSGFFRTLPGRYVEFPQGEYDPFFNVNTPEDFTRALAIARSLPSLAAPPSG